MHARNHQSPSHARRGRMRRRMEPGRAMGGQRRRRRRGKGFCSMIWSIMVVDGRIHSSYVINSEQIFLSKRCLHEKG